MSFSNGELSVLSTALGDSLYKIKDDEMKFPVTSLAWRPTIDTELYGQTLLGACCDGSILKWQANRGNSVDHIMLNERN